MYTKKSFSLIAVNHAVLRPITTFIHHLGHKWAIRILYKDVHPKVNVQENGNKCNISYNEHELSRIGKIFGEAAAKNFVIAAGPLAEMATVFAPLAIGNSNPLSFVFFMNFVETWALNFPALWLHNEPDNDHNRLINQYGLPGSNLYLLHTIAMLFLALRLDGSFFTDNSYIPS